MAFEGKTVVIDVSVKGVEEMEIEMGVEDSGGSAVLVNMNKDLRQHMAVGWLALALHAVMSQYALENQLDQHWIMVHIGLMDALRENDQSLQRELIEDGSISAEEGE